MELLRDLYVWAYERSTQEYLAIKQALAEPDPTRLAYRELIKQTIARWCNTLKPTRWQPLRSAWRKCPRPTAMRCRRWLCRNCVVCMKGCWRGTDCARPSW